MKVLAIDLSSARGSAAVATGGRVIDQRYFACERGRGAGVFAALEAMRNSWLGVELIAVGVGPGSYNGLRASCALTISMQLSTGARLCSSPSPCILEVRDNHFFVYGDARGGRAYRAEVRDRSLCGEVVLLDYAAAAESAEKDGAAALRVGPLACLEHLPEAQPDASVLALLAPGLPPLEPDALQPIYLKPPHITVPRAVRT
ncbi:MAG: tRNA threonylcarbamoyladenosine biosynthesis protein TsaB [Verrucomicrobiota bacterium]|jgi:tRNA A37 threonylcarbamoyladenosine modification protein TsaB